MPNAWDDQVTDPVAFQIEGLGWVEGVLPGSVRLALVDHGAMFQGTPPPTPPPAPYWALEFQTIHCGQKRWQGHRIEKVLGARGLN